MRPFSFLFLLLLLRSAEPRRGSPRSGRGHRSHPRPGALEGYASDGDRVRGRGRAGAVRRQTQECNEYVEAGEKYLDCQDRQLTTVMQGWPKDIHHLLLSRNKIQVLRDNMFSQFTQLRSLDLQQNHISMVEDGAFAGLSHLTTLLLQHNRLWTASEEVLLPMPRLTYLRLYDNPWSCDCALDSLVGTLQVPSHRNLGNYAKCAEPPSLRGQKLKKVNQDLLCAGGDRPTQNGGGGGGGSSGTVVTPPKELPVKTDVNTLCRTYMFPKPLMDCSGKGEFFLTATDMKSVPAHLPSDLFKLDLSGNSIQHLTPKHFLFAKDLKHLNLSNNGLERIDKAAFSGLLHLRELDLSNNSLQHFQYGVLEDLYFLRRLSLAGNPWVCDYSVHYLIYWLKHHPGVFHSGLRCAEPKEFRGWRVEDYVKTYNGECPKGQADHERRTTWWGWSRRRRRRRRRERGAGAVGARARGGSPAEPAEEKEAPEV
ncbi:Leucine-rich repeat-containing protein 17 [Merluccius polli]|uniref:Leucine-rich repeat-containing protein 17 n=1 Tax=Merluccius polli TaxID=89951 RepID=A0AA47M0F3_MERPO|nr:Leucine-rich repeat-containing protein 17 [Merluccius polli]